MLRALVVLSLAVAALSACRDGNLADRAGAGHSSAGPCVVRADCPQG